MIVASLVFSILYLLLICAFLWAFTRPASKVEDNAEYVSIDDLLNDKE